MQKRSSGDSRRSMNNVPSRGALVDPQTYGMLLWQSKLQEKLLQEQKENRKRETEEQQRRIREREQLQYADKDRSQYQQQHGAQASTTPILEIPPQMIPGPAPYIIASPALAAPSPSQQHPGNNTAVATCSPPENNVPNGSTTSPVGMDQQPMFPNISTTRLRTSVSCDNFGKGSSQQQPPPPGSLHLGNLISFQQMGGAGSPRRSPSGKLLTILRGDPEIRYHQKDTRGFDQSMRYLMDRDKVVEYKRELDRQLEEQRKWRSRLGSAAIKEITRKDFIENGSSHKSRTSAQSDHLHLSHSGGAGGGGATAKSGTELAPLMRKFNSLPKLNGLSSTDVTRPFVHSPRNEFFHHIQPNEVAENLSSQLREKEWLSRRQQESERMATERHFQTWDSLWGRPGAGAPLSFPEKNLGHAVSFGNLYGGSRPTEQRGFGGNAGYNKINLFKAIHMPHHLQQQQSRPK